MWEQKSKYQLSLRVEPAILVWEWLVFVLRAFDARGKKKGYSPYKLYELHNFCRQNFQKGRKFDSLFIFR